MWILGTSSGGWKMTGRNAVDGTGITVINGSCLCLQSTMVPPLALDFRRGSSGSNKSAEFREEKYSDASVLMALSKSLA